MVSLEVGSKMGWFRQKKRGYRVRLKGADHQWGKDPPKEVVG
jgi:hypothetical protein